MIKRIPVEQQTADRLEQRQITPETNRKVQVRQSRSLPNDAARLLRVLETNQASLAQRIDREDFRTASLSLLEGTEHPWMIRTRVLPGDHDQMGPVQVLGPYRTFANSDDLAQCDGSRLMAHVGAIGQIVGAEGSHEQLEDKGGFVRDLSGRVEDGFVGVVEGLEVMRDQGEGVVPADRLVMGGAGPKHHRVTEAALLSQPVVGALLQLGDRVGGEELRPDLAGRRLLGDRLRTVLAELCPVAMGRVRIRPRAALAVESFSLIELEQSSRRSGQPHLVVGVTQGDSDSLDASSVIAGSRDGDASFVDVATGSFAAHRQPALPLPASPALPPFASPRPAPTTSRGSCSARARGKVPIRSPVAIGMNGSSQRVFESACM